MAFATILRRSACSVTPLANRLVETQRRHHHFAIFTALYHTPLSHNPSSSPFLQTFRPSFSAAAKPPRSDVDSDYHDRQTKFGSQSELLTSSIRNGVPSVSMLQRGPRPGLYQCAAVVPTFPHRSMTTMGNPVESVPQDSSASIADIAPRIKFKRLDKTAKHIMQILDKEAVEEVRAQREIPVIKRGYIIQLKVVVPENKRRVSTLKGIVIAKRNSGLNSTFRLRRQVAGIGVESLFPLYSPNIKEIKVLDKKRVRRAKLYYLRDKMNALKKH